MRLSMTLAFTGLFILVSYFYFNFKPASAPKPSDSAESPTPTMELLPEEERSIRFIQIQKINKNEIIAIERVHRTEGQAADWVLRYPVRYPADSMIVEGLAAALKYSKKARKFPAERPWEEYGLDKPSLKVGIESEGSAKRKYLYFGDPSLVGNFVFARWEGEKEYFLIQSQLKNIFNVSLYSLRAKRVFTLPAGNLLRVSVRTFDQNFALEKRGGGWFWAEPLSEEKISEKRMKKILSFLVSLHIKEFLEEETVDIKSIFSSSAPFIQIVSQTDRREKLVLGQEIPEREAYYAMQEGEQDTVFLVSRDRIQKLFSLLEKASPKPVPLPAAAT